MINGDRIKTKLRYKCAIKEAIVAADEEFDDGLANYLCNEDVNSFGSPGGKDFVLKILKLLVD